MPEQSCLCTQALGGLRSERWPGGLPAHSGGINGPGLLESGESGDRDVVGAWARLRSKVWGLELD
eukprot:1477063-Lingulodinium_polyedra.AAC.1